MYFLHLGGRLLLRQCEQVSTRCVTPCSDSGVSIGHAWLEESSRFALLYIPKDPCKRNGGGGGLFQDYGWRFLAANDVKVDMTHCNAKMKQRISTVQSKWQNTTLIGWRRVRSRIVVHSKTPI